MIIQSQIKQLIYLLPQASAATSFPQVIGLGATFNMYAMGVPS